MLSQWRGYCGHDGVAAVFDRKGLEQLLEPERERFLYLSCSLEEVVYDRGNVELDDGKFPGVVEAFEDLARALPPQGRASESTKKQCQTRLVERLLPAMARVKHRAFADETECRVVAVLPGHEKADSRQTPNHRTQRTKSVHHRAAERGSIPYIRLFKDPDSANTDSSRLRRAFPDTQTFRPTQQWAMSHLDPALHACAAMGSRVPAAAERSAPPTPC